MKCRICKMEINYQSYKNHMKAQHPDEDCGDLKDYNQPTLFGKGWLKRKKSGEEEEEEEEEEKRDHVDEEEKEQGEEETHQGAGELKTESVDMSLDETAEEVKTVADTEESMEAEKEDELVDAKAVNDRLRQMLNKIESGIDVGSRATEVEKLTSFWILLRKDWRSKLTSTVW